MTNSLGSLGKPLREVLSFGLRIVLLTMLLENWSFMILSSYMTNGVPSFLGWGFGHRKGFPLVFPFGLIVAIYRLLSDHFSGIS